MVAVLNRRVRCGGLVFGAEDAHEAHRRRTFHVGFSDSRRGEAFSYVCRRNLHLGRQDWNILDGTDLGQQGIQAGRSTQTTLNGNPAAYAPFTAQSQDGGTLSGLVAFESYGGNTYQLLGLTNTSYATYDRTFQGFVASFRRLTDPAVLSVKPNRIQIVRVRSSMTLAAFNQQNPSVVPIDELALINGMADGNAVIAAGASVKRVVTR